jgi:hypothetical protein
MSFCAEPNRTMSTTSHESVAVLLGKGETLHFTLQNISEFWNVATRPLEINGLGFSIDLTLSEIEKSSEF